MTHHPQDVSPIFHIDVSADPSSGNSSNGAKAGDESAMIVSLLERLVIGQQQQNKLLEELSSQLGAAQKQRSAELGQWKNANPRLAKNCRTAAEILGRVQTQFLENVTQEITDTQEHLIDGEFMLNEFVDRYGPRLAHLNGVLQVLTQLSSSSSQDAAS